MAKLFDWMQYLDGEPGYSEVERLKYYYPKYETELHRKNWLSGYLHGKSHRELSMRKIKDQGLDPSKLTLQQMNGHRGWVTKKSKRLIIRLLFLRYAIDQGMSRANANSHPLGIFPTKAEDFGKSTIRKHTRGTVPLPSETRQN